MSNPCLSVVIPVLNEEKNIENILKDILRNSYKNYEIIVIDNGCVDKTREIIKKFIKKNSNIKLINVPKKGISIAKNAGAKHSKGDYILFLDADTRLTKTFIKNSIEEMIERKLNLGAYYIKPNKDKKIDKLMWNLCNNLIFRPLQYTPFASATGGGGIIIEKEFHNFIRGFDEEFGLAQDHDYLKRGCRKGKFRILKKEKAEFNMRRFDNEGRLRVWAKWIIESIFFTFGSKMKKLPFKYEFGKLN